MTRSALRSADEPGEARFRVLLVEDDPAFSRAVCRGLGLRGWQVQASASSTAAKALLDTEEFAAVIVDLHLPDASGIDVIEHALRRRPAPVALLMSARVDVPTTVRAMQAGALDVLEKPVDMTALGDRLSACLGARRLQQSSAPGPTELDAAVLGEGPSIRALRENIRSVAPFHDLSVLIVGETGTGKELVAEWIHRLSGVPGDFVAVNCAAVPEQLFESEVFGHEAGAFTGARAARPGLLETVGAGTLFLDEIGEMPATLQPKLLRALESRTFRRVGGVRDAPFRARVVSATNRDVSGSSAALRPDLYYRLCGFTLSVPALRDRKEDVGVLARHFLAEFCGRHPEVCTELGASGLEALEAYAWPGNVRELRTIVRQAAMLAPSRLIEARDVAPLLRSTVAEQRTAAPSSSPSPPVGPARPRMRELERQMISDTWLATNGNLSAAARALGLPRTTLRDRLRRYGLR